MELWDLVIEANSEGEHVGYIRNDIWDVMAPYNYFHLSADGSRVDFPSEYATLEHRSLRIAEILEQWRSDKIFVTLDGWRNELYPIYSHDRNSDGNSKVLLTIERAAAPLFGIRVFGCHLNAFARVSGNLHVWIAKRSPSKQTYPGMLDNCVGGGLPIGITPTANIIKEANEEAGIQESLAKRAIPCSHVSFIKNSSRGIVLETDYVYDLELDNTFIPHPADNEVEEFYVFEYEKIMEELKARKFTPEAGLIMIDFFIRHGYITPESEGRYLEIITNLRNSLNGLPGP